MTEKVNAGAAPVVENVEKKVVRRGIGSARGTSRLKFSNEMAARNGLFIGHLDSVEVSMIKIGEDSTGMPSFNGYEIPKLILTFASNEDEIVKRHYVTLTFTAVESNVETIPGGKKEWTVNSIFDWMKHLLTVYVTKGREFTLEEESSLTLPFVDFDENGEYNAVSTEEVIAGWKQLFENFADMLNHYRDGEPAYKDASNKPISVWLKLVRYIKSNKKGWSAVNNGELAFPAFVGEGCVEIYKKNMIPSIKLNPIRETITIMKVEEPKKPNMPVPNMGGMNTPMMAGGVPVEDINTFGAGMNNINDAAADDMPF